MQGERWVQVCGLIGLMAAGLVGQAWGAPVGLQVNGRVDPLGIDDLRPSLSWRSDDASRDWRQAAYRIEVASTPEQLQAGKADVWDSGRVSSGESVGIPYGGPALKTGQRYFWSVRTWSGDGKEETSGAKAGGQSAWWEMGLLAASDWKAGWIGQDRSAEHALVERVHWMWLPGGNPQSVPSGEKAVFVYRLHLDKAPESAVLHVLTGGTFTASVNGRETGTKEQWAAFDREDVRGWLKAGAGTAGDNVIQIAETARSSRESGKTFPDAVAAVLQMRGSDGRPMEVVSGPQWQARSGSAEPGAGGAMQAATDAGALKDLKVSVGSDRNVMIAAPDELESRTSLVRGTFLVKGAVRSARLYVTAMGAYRAFLNGTRVGDGELTPGFTDFRKRVQYQTYDVTSMLRPGENVLGAMLAAGWHGSPLLWAGVRLFPGPNLLRAQLELTMADGSRKTIGSDTSWKVADAPTTAAEIYGGESYDARLERSGWATTGYREGAGWTPAMTGEVSDAVEVTAQPDQTPHMAMTLKPTGVKQLPPEDGQPTVSVYDMGQNMVGVVQLRVRGQRGATVRLRFAERLNPDGSVYTKNLRDADATDDYTLKGGGEEQWAPAFTFHGFRYVELTKMDAAVSSVSLEGQVINSLPDKPSIQFKSSSELLNQMFELGLWGERGNYLSIPTDCPQRDERMGWMGDAGVFWRTGSYNFDIDSFSHKFLHDVRDAQTADGQFSNISPNLLRGAEAQGAPGWGDAGVLVPYATWMQYGDRAVLERNWDAMEKWMAFIERSNPNLLREKELGANYGDWLAPDPNTPRDLVGTAYWALLAQQMTEMARALGKTEEASKYEALHGRIQAAYQAKFVNGDGTVEGGTQTAYLLTLYTGLATEAQKKGMTDRLVANIEAHKDHLTTGFLGTPFLLFVLEEQGRSDVAFRLLLNDTYPSWGYMVAKGATTWWERWNGDTGDPSMNSYNHYAFGSVMAFVYRRVSGVDTSASGPGFHHVMIRPQSDAKLTSATTTYDSAYGAIATDWTRTADGGMHLALTLPANTTATVSLPASGAGQLMEGGKPIASKREGNRVVAEVGSGRYAFATQ